MSTIVPLFTTLLQKLNHNPPKDLLDYVDQYYQQNKYRGYQRSSRLAWQSKPIPHIDELQQVQQHIDDNIYCTRKLIHQPAWININHQGAYNVTHVHPDVDYTVVYYLTDDNSKIILHNPMIYGMWNHLTFLDDQLKKEYNMQVDYPIKPNKGDILIFPAFVPHYVESNTKAHERMSISWGMSFR